MIATAGIDELAAAIVRRKAILFVGAGVSMSVGLPSWAAMVQHMAEDLHIAPSTLEGVSFQTLAEFYRLQSGSIGPLRSWMDRHWHVGRDEIAKSQLHTLIVELDFPIIYTTNYDRNLEAAFELHGCEYNRIANARDLAAAHETVTQIVKFHGDFDDDSSLVLAETDYFDRLSFEAPLDVKFKADALGRTMLFIGYSMSDINIRLLLHRMWQTWQRSGHQADRPKSFIFMPEGNIIQEKVLGSWGLTLLQGSAGSPGDALTELLIELRDRVQRIGPDSSDKAHSAIPGGPLT
jgi:hypothetical protein